MDYKSKERLSDHYRSVEDRVNDSSVNAKHNRLNRV